MYRPLTEAFRALSADDETLPPNTSDDVTACCQIRLRIIITLSPSIQQTLSNNLFYFHVYSLKLFTININLNA